MPRANGKDMVLMDALRNFASPYASATEILGVPVAFDQENVTRSQGELINAVLGNFNFLYF